MHATNNKQIRILHGGNLSLYLYLTTQRQREYTIVYYLLPFFLLTQKREGETEREREESIYTATTMWNSMQRSSWQHSRHPLPPHPPLHPPLPIEYFLLVAEAPQLPWESYPQSYQKAR